MSRFDDIVDMYVKVFGNQKTRSEIERLVEKNLRRPSAVRAPSDITDLISSETYEKLEDLHIAYKSAITQELETGLFGSQRRRMLELALDSPTMDLSLISSQAERSRLDRQFQDLVFGGYEASYGLPSIQLPSGNPRRATVYGTSQPGVDNALDYLLEGRAISVDITKPGIGQRAMRVSATDIPTAQYLREGLTQKNTTRILDDTLAEARSTGSRVRIAALDVETGGVGPYDQVRSLSIGYYDLDPTLASSREAIRGMPMNPTSSSNVHMIVPEMESVRAGRRGDVAVGLGTRTFQIETGLSSGALDLSTGLGRASAASNYEKQIRELLDPNTFIVGNKVGSFDLPKIINSAAALDEFMSVPERALLLKKLQEKISSGTHVIDVTQLAGEHIFKKMAGLQQLAELSGTNIEDMMDQAVVSILSPEAALKAGRFGESVKPRSIESILLTTDLLERLSSTTDGQQIIQRLSSGAHVSEVDLQLSAAILRGVQADEMELLTPSSPRGTIAGVSIDSVQAARIEAARVSISRYGAMLPTTNLANIEEVSDQVFDFLSTTTDPRIVQGMRISTREGYLEYNKSTGQFEEVIKGVARPIPQPVAERQIKGVLSSVRSATTEEARNTAKSKILSFGISASEAGQMQRTIEYADIVSSTGVTVPGSMIDLLNTTSGQETFVESMSVTRRFAGMPHLQERNLLVDRIMGRSMRDRQAVVNESNVPTMMRTLQLGRAGMEMIDPTMRSNFVAASSITADIAFSTSEGRKATALRVARQQFLMENPGATADVIEAHLATLSGEQIESLATRAEQILGGRNLLSEMGVVTFRETTPSIMKAGGSGGIGRIRLTQKALSDLRIRSTAGGAFDTPFLESTLYESAGLSRMHLSEVVLQDGTKMMNLVMGEGRIGRQESKSLAEGLVDMWRRKLIDDQIGDETLISEGIFQSKEEISNIRGILQRGNTAIQDELITPIMEQFSQHGGPVRGTVTGDVAEGLASLTHSMSQSVGNDQVAVSRGFVLRTAGTDEGLIYAVPGMTRSVEAHAASMGIAMPDASQILQDRDTVLAKAESNKGFRNMLKQVFSRHGVDEGIGGTSVGANRLARDASIREMVQKVKPGAYKVGIGVAALSAGYYLARRGRDKQLYEQVMHEQPTENPGLVQQANYDMQDATMIDSVRRDPLVTAGVVGNLDRNKIGHTMMGPNKYNHLFGA